MSSYDIYTFDTFEATTNSHTTSRGENWQLRKHSSAETLEDAKDIVRVMSRRMTDLPIFLADLNTQAQKDAFVDEFCFDNDMYISYRRFFIGRPNMKKVKAALVQKGILVLS